MPRYHFNVHDGQDLPDEEGVELPNHEAARQHSVRYAGALLSEAGKSFWEGDEWYIEVTDDRGLVQFRLMFIAIDAPSTQGRKQPS